LKMGFLVVEFSSALEEFAVISIKKVRDGTLRALKDSLVGKTVDVLWGRKMYSVKVRGFGPKSEMETMCNILAEEAANEDGESAQNAKHVEKPKTSKTSPAGRIIKILNKRKRLERSDASTLTSKASKVCSENILLTPRADQNDEPAIPTDDGSVDETSQDPDATVLKLTTKVEKLKASVQKYKERSRDLNRQILELKQQHALSSAEDTIEITAGTGIYLQKALLAAAKLTSKTPTILARSLFRQLFQPDEMKGHSLFGRTCNTNKSSEVFSSVDGNKRDALIDKTLLQHISSKEAHRPMKMSRLIKMKMVNSVYIQYTQHEIIKLHSKYSY
ncbi:unnamed protein product, partial [Allacma fusca]